MLQGNYSVLNYICALHIMSMYFCWKETNVQNFVRVVQNYNAKRESLISTKFPNVGK